MKCQKLESQFYNSIKWGDFHTWNRKLVGGDTYEKIKKEIKFFFSGFRFHGPFKDVSCLYSGSTPQLCDGNN